MKNDKRLIIIGADGFIGSSITNYLRQSGWSIYATVFNRPPLNGEITLDITSPEEINQLPRGIPLINTAGLPDQSAGISLMRKVHVGGMKNLLTWARSADCPHLIQLSSISVYGNATVGTGRIEAATPRRSWNPVTAPLAYGPPGLRPHQSKGRSPPGEIGDSLLGSQASGSIRPGGQFFHQADKAAVKGFRPPPSSGWGETCFHYRSGSDWAADGLHPGLWSSECSP